MFFAVGNYPANEMGSMVVQVATDGTITFETTLAEEGSCITLLRDGTDLLVPGIDPTESWAFGNLHTRDSGGTWVKVRNLTNVIHSFGGCIHSNGELYVATGAHSGNQTTFQGRVFRSSDHGANWTSVVVNNNRIYDVISFNSKLWAIGETLSGSKILYVSSNDGTSWSTFSGVQPKILPRMVVWQNKLVILENDNDIFTIDTSDGTFSYPPPPQNVDVGFNVFAVNGTDLYALCNGRIYRTPTLTAWEYWASVPNAVTLLSWPGQSLVVSEMGSSARLLTVPFN